MTAPTQVVQYTEVTVAFGSVPTSFAAIGSPVFTPTGSCRFLRISSTLDKALQISFDGTNVAYTLEIGSTSVQILTLAFHDYGHQCFPMVIKAATPTVGNVRISGFGVL